MTGNGQIAVIGAGVAGVAAAYAAASAGARVVLLDEQDAPGGWLRTSLQMIPDPPEPFGAGRGFDLAASAGELLAASAVDYRPRSIAWGLFENRTLGVIGPDGAYQLHPSKIILATGSTEIVWPFAGWTLPGIMTARAARAVMHLYFVLPGRRVAVIGSGEDANQMVQDLEMAGADSVHRFMTPDGLEAGGSVSIEWIVQGERRLDVDAAILALGSSPDPELARHALAELEFSELDGCHVPARDAHMMTSIDGVFVVGDAAGMTTIAEACAQGLVAGHAATASEELAGVLAAASDIAVERSRHVDVGDPSRIPDQVQVDREEQITAGQIREAIASGAVSINDVKRKTRAGMGVSQGRDTEYVIARMIHDQTAISLDQLVPMTARPPARLVPLAALSSIANVSG